MKYLSLNEYLKTKFGCKVYKIAIDGGFTCPNRDGTLGTNGCIFCSGFGSGDFASDRNLSITEQIERAKEKVSSKISNGKYIAYFQAFTNTYAPVNELRNKFSEAINHPDVVAVSIGTRPDCLPEDVLELLSELNRIKPIWIELGLQTIHEKTADFIRRGYDLSIYDKAVYELKHRGLYVVTHVILGLPGESEKDVLKTVEYVCKNTTYCHGDNVLSCQIDGIKLQLLHIIKGTDLELFYNDKSNNFECMDMDTYVDLIRKCVNIIPSNIAIHRLTGDGDKKTLVAPLWSGDKKRVLNAINKALSN